MRVLQIYACRYSKYVEQKNTGVFMGIALKCLFVLTLVILAMIFLLLVISALIQFGALFHWRPVLLVPSVCDAFFSWPPVVSAVAFLAPIVVVVKATYCN